MDAATLSCWWHEVSNLIARTLAASRLDTIMQMERAAISLEARGQSLRVNEAVTKDERFFVGAGRHDRLEVSRRADSLESCLMFGGLGRNERCVHPGHLREPGGDGSQHDERKEKYSPSPGDPDNPAERKPVTGVTAY